MQVWVVSVRGQVGGMIERVRCRGEKLLLPLSLHVQGKKKHSAVQNGTVSCSLLFFFFGYLCGDQQVYSLLISNTISGFSNLDIYLYHYLILTLISHFKDIFNF
jgi:hypothetical protein